MKHRGGIEGFCHWSSRAWGSFITPPPENNDGIRGTSCCDYRIFRCSRFSLEVLDFRRHELIFQGRGKKYVRGTRNGKMALVVVGGHESSFRFWGLLSCVHFFFFFQE